MNKTKELNILGQKYTYIETENSYDERLQHANGACDRVEKVIIIDTNNEQNDLERVKRHEILHAFIAEAGIEELNTETNVDFFAFQWEKINNILKEVENHELYK